MHPLPSSPSRPWSSILLPAAAWMALALPAAPARAQCEPPTELECYASPEDASGYFQTECGLAEREAMRSSADAACNQIIAARAAAERPASVREGLAPVPAGMSRLDGYDPERDYISPAEVASYDPRANPVHVLGGTASYAGAAARFRAEALSQASANVAAGAGAGAGAGTSAGGSASAGAGAGGGASLPVSSQVTTSLAGGTLRLAAAAAGASSLPSSTSATLTPDAGQRLGASVGTLTVTGSTAVGGAGAVSVVADLARQRQRWEANGNQVTSCEEYVYERYYDYSRYEDMAAARGSDYRTIFAQGYPKLVNGVQSRSGVLVAKVPENPQPLEKNAFFTYRPTYPEGTQPYAFRDPGLLARLDAGRAFYAHTVAWHGQMNDALSPSAQAVAGLTSARASAVLAAAAGAPVLAPGGPSPTAKRDDLLFALAQKQSEFAALLAKRDAVYRRLTAWRGAVAAGLGDSVCNPTEVPPDAYLKPWMKIWDPADFVQGIDLKRYYAPAAYASLAVAAAAPAAAPAELPPMTIMSAGDGDGDDGGGGGEGDADPADMSALAAGACEELLAPDGLPRVIKYPCRAALAASVCDPVMAEAVAARLRQIDEEEIEPAFDEVAPWGCLDMGSAAPATANGTLTGRRARAAALPLPSLCDWNPEMFAREMESHFSSERERDFRQCMNATHGEFDAGDPIHFASAGPEPIATPERAALLRARGVTTDLGCDASACRADYTDSTEHVLAFLQLYEQWSHEVDFQRDPVTHKAIPGHSAGDSDDMGNSLFGVSYAFDAGWRLDGLPKNGQQNLDSELCKVGLSAHAGARAGGRLFGQDIDLVDAYAFVGSTQQSGRTGRAELRLSVLGKDILVEDGTDGSAAGSTGVGRPEVAFHVSKERGESQTLATFTIVVAGFPVTVRAGVAGRVAFGFDAAVGLQADCPKVSTTLTGGMGPSASLDMFVSGGLNLAIVEVGVQVDLTLLRLDLPLTLDFRIAPYQPTLLDILAGKAAADPLMISANPKLELILTSLAGRLRAYARFPIGSPLYVTLFEWKGVELGRTTLFDPTWNYSLTRIAAGVGN